MEAATAAPPTFERWLNFRDLGGMPTQDGRRLRRGVLFRAMTPEHMTDADVASARQLDLSLIIDLRGRRFQEQGYPLDQGALRVSLGSRKALRPSLRQLDWLRQADPAEAMPYILDRLSAAYARGASLLAKTNGPALVHCRLGKDRTGVFIALVLKLLGVSDEDVIQDYLASAAANDAMHTLLHEMGEPANFATSRVSTMPPSREAMEAVLSRLESEYGGARGYFLKQRLSPRTLDALAEKLLEPA